MMDIMIKLFIFIKIDLVKVIPVKLNHTNLNIKSKGEICVKH